MSDTLIIVLSVLAGLLVLGFAAWATARVLALGRRQLKALVRLLFRIPRRGVSGALADELRARVRSSVELLASWADAERPSLRAAAAPDGTVTIVFTDIEGSTALNERLGDRRWLRLLRGHNAIVRAAVRRHGGQEVKSQGDGFMIAFPSAGRALSCATSIQRAFAGGQGPDTPQLRVRIGVHTGDALRSGNDLYGRTVIIAARIAERAHGGEILVSRLVKELTAGAEEIEFEHAAEAELKGVSEPQHLYRVRPRARGGDDGSSRLVFRPVEQGG